MSEKEREKKRDDPAKERGVTSAGARQDREGFSFGAVVNKNE